MSLLLAFDNALILDPVQLDGTSRATVGFVSVPRVGRVEERDDRARCVWPHFEDFFVSGYTTSFGQGARAALVMRLDSVGDTVWTKAYSGSGSDYANAVVGSQGGVNFYVAGYSSSFSSNTTSVQPSLAR